MSEAQAKNITEENVGYWSFNGLLKCFLCDLVIPLLPVGLYSARAAPSVPGTVRPEAH